MMSQDHSHETRLYVQGMDCASCAFKIEKSLKKIAGTESVQVNVHGGWVHITGDIDANAARKSIRKLGYTVAGNKHDGHDHHHSHIDPADEGKAWWQTGKGRLVMIASVLIAISYGMKSWMPQYGQWPFVVATLVALYPVAKRAFAAARSGSVFTIEMLVTIAAIGAIAIDTIEEASVVVLLFLVGELLEGVTSLRARQSIRALGDLTPDTAWLVDGDRIVETKIDDIVPGQIVQVRAGDRIPCDGVIGEGETDIDEAPVTGESQPRSKHQGDDVFAGTINLSGTIRVIVSRAANDNTIARIIRLVDEAQASKAPVERFVDRFARIYMPVIVVLALLVALVPPLWAGQAWDVWTYRALALLLIACPCALVISTPAAIAAALSAGARRGLLIKGGIVLESLGVVKTIAFDKTGTLTEGKPTLTDIVGFNVTDDKILSVVSALEQSSAHPIAHAILKSAQDKNIIIPQASDIQTLSGKGIQGIVDGQLFFILNPRAAQNKIAMPVDIHQQVISLEEQGKTVSLLLDETAFVGLFAVRDEPREDAISGISELKDLGIQSIMLTGDNKRAAQAIAHDLGIVPYAELMPEDKARIIHELNAQGQGPVGKVGDGINDAPALAAARVGIAMGGGTAIALEAADAALLRNSVSGVADLVRLSRATLSNIHVNITMALGSKAIFLVTTVLGMTGMWVAVMADTGATVLVTLNAMRLLKFPTPSISRQKKV
jgi:Cd2+/Zn2+-exporting ATPase